MPKYPLEDLLRVRRFREDDAAAEVTRRRADVARARQLVIQRETQLAEYIEWRHKREKELYDGILGRVIPMSDLDDVKWEVQALRDKEESFREQILLAKKALSESEVALDEALSRYQSAVRDRQKIDEHKSGWLEEVNREAEAYQDKELEEFKSRVWDDDEVEEEVEYG